MSRTSLTATTAIAAVLAIGMAAAQADQQSQQTVFNSEIYTTVVQTGAAGPTGTTTLQSGTYGPATIALTNSTCKKDRCTMPLAALDNLPTAKEGNDIIAAAGNVNAASGELPMLVRNLDGTTFWSPVTYDDARQMTHRFGGGTCGGIHASTTVQDKIGQITEQQWATFDLASADNLEQLFGGGFDTGRFIAMFGTFGTSDPPIAIMRTLHTAKPTPPSPADLGAHRSSAL